MLGTKNYSQEEGPIIYEEKKRRQRNSFAMRALKEHEDTFWAHDISLYLGAASFVHKYRPLKQASYPMVRVYIEG